MGDRAERIGACTARVAPTRRPGDQVRLRGWWQASPAGASQQGLGAGALECHAIPGGRRPRQIFASYLAAGVTPCLLREADPSANRPRCWGPSSLSRSIDPCGCRSFAPRHDLETGKPQLSNDAQRQLLDIAAGVLFNGCGDNAHKFEFLSMRGHSYILDMARPDLTEEDYSDLAALVRDAIDAEPYRVGPRMTKLTGLLIMNS